MPYKEVFECAVCGTQKKETNHWWNISKGEAFFIDVFNARVVIEGFCECVCSTECTQKLLARWQDEIIQAANFTKKQELATQAN